MVEWEVRWRKENGSQIELHLCAIEPYTDASIMLPKASKGVFC